MEHRIKSMSNVRDKDFQQLHRVALCVFEAIVLKALPNNSSTSISHALQSLKNIGLGPALCDKSHVRGWDDPTHSHYFFRFRWASWTTQTSRLSVTADFIALGHFLVLRRRRCLSLSTSLAVLGSLSIVCLYLAWFDGVVSVRIALDTFRTAPFHSSFWSGPWVYFFRDNI